MSSRSWVLWLRVPWSEVATAAALIVATTAPVLLTTSAELWKSAAEDDVARRTVSEAPLERNGFDLTIEVAFDPETMADADAEITDALSSVGDLTEPLRSFATLPGLVTVGPPVRSVGPSGRVFAQDGALDAVTILEELPDTAGGVWITSWFAERHDVELGDSIGFDAGSIADEEWNDILQGGGAGRVFRVVGTYEALWSVPGEASGPVDQFWTSAAPSATLPRYIPAFDGPNTELILAEESTLLDSTLTGIARWRAIPAGAPDSFEELRTRRDQVRTVERDLVGDTDLAAAVRAVSTSANRRPQLQTELFETTATATTAVAQLERPMSSVRAVGTIVGMTVVCLAGWFTVDRRRSEYRLLCSEGRGPLDVTMRSAAQFAAPVAVGTTVGVVAAVLGTWWFGPATGVSVASMPWTTVGLVAGASLAALAVTTGLVGARSLRSVPALDVGRVATVLAVVSTGATVFLWSQIGRPGSGRATSVDMSVVALPIVALLLATLVAVALVTLVLRHLGTQAAKWPDVAYLAVRRFGAGAAGMQLVAAAVGLGVGLVVFASALTSTLERTVDVKLATEIGAESSAELSARLPAGVVLPPGSTVVDTFDTVLIPGDVRLRIVALDPRTFADAVTWPDEFGSDPERVLRALAGPIDGTVPVIAVGDSVPSNGAFGFTQAYPFRVVDRVEASPLAGSLPLTILVDATRIDEFALDEAGFEDRQDAEVAGFLLPTDRFRHRVLSQASVDELVDALTDADVVVRSTASTAQRRAAPDLLASRAAFGYLGVLGVVAASVALAALALFLAARRRSRSIANAMTRSMGLSARRAASVTALEVALLLAVAVATSLVAVPIVTRRLSGRFDPQPRLPPEVPITVDWWRTGTAAGGAVAVIVAIVWVAERRLASRPTAELLRDGR